MKPDRPLSAPRSEAWSTTAPAVRRRSRTCGLIHPDHGEVRVRMVGSGVCHSDLHVVDGDWERPVDVVLGHEGAGVIEELGPGVQERAPGDPPELGGLRVGDLVVLAWTAPCGACPSCSRGEAWLCSAPMGSGHRLDPGSVRLHRADGSAVGVYSGIGTFCTGQVVAAQAVIPVDPRTPYAVAALIGCAATTGVGAVRQHSECRGRGVGRRPRSRRGGAGCAHGGRGGGGRDRHRGRCRARQAGAGPGAGGDGDRHSGGRFPSWRPGCRRAGRTTCSSASVSRRRPSWPCGWSGRAAPSRWWA